MKKIYFIALFATLSTLCGCSTPTEGEDSTLVGAPSELSIGLPIGISRTAMDSDGKASWTDGDSFSLWAENRTGAYVLNAAEFKMMYYWHSMQSAVFTSNANPIAEGTYTYYAVSPMPQTVNDRKATYTIPAEQQGGEFNGAYDIMVATPLEAGAVVADKVNNLALDFQHKMHTLKISIAKNDLGIDIQELRFTFPTNVTGQVAVDITNAEAATALTNGSSQLIVKSKEGFSVGDTVWGVIFPQNISGDIELTAVGTDGRLSKEKTISLSKECLAGHITPLSLSVPSGRSTLRFSIGTNNLGEEIQKLTITDNTGASVTWDKTTNNVYDVVVDNSLDTVFDHYEGKTFTARFESANAIVSTTFVMPSNLSNGVNVIPALTVPYLFFEDFSCIHTDYKVEAGDENKASEDRNQSGVNLNNYMSHMGWNGARIRLQKATCPRINARLQKTASWASQHYGRLDSPALSNLKDGVSVKIKVTFDVGGVEYVGDYFGQDVISVNVVSHTNAASVIDGIPVGATGVFGTYDTTLGDFGTVQFSHSISANCGLSDFGKTFPTYSGNVSSATKSTRICFYPSTTITLGFIGNNEVAFYIDNIKVQIAQ